MSVCAVRRSSAFIVQLVRGLNIVANVLCVHCACLVLFTSEICGGHGTPSPMPMLSGLCSPSWRLRVVTGAGERGGRGG